MNEESMRRDIIEQVLWADARKLSPIWHFVSAFLRSEKKAEVRR